MSNIALSWGGHIWPNYSVLELWTEILDSGDPIDAVNLDFQRLHAKIIAYGINGQILDWTQAFLTDRKQRVVVNSCPSAWLEVLSGIPQGSVLGPMLFVIFGNDLPDMIHNTTHIFADDKRLIVFREWLHWTASGSSTTRWVDWEETTTVQCKILWRIYRRLV